MKDIMKIMLEERMHKVAIDAYNSSSLRNTPFEGMIIMNAVGVSSKNLKAGFILEKKRLGLSEQEIINLVDEAASNVLNKLVSFGEVREEEEQYEEDILEEEEEYEEEDEQNAKNFFEKAVNIISENSTRHELESAIEIIDEGLRCNDGGFEGTLFQLRAECNLRMGEYFDALIDVQDALLSSKAFNNNIDRVLCLGMKKKIKIFYGENYDKIRAEISFRRRFGSNGFEVPTTTSVAAMCAIEGWSERSKTINFSEFIDEYGEVLPIDDQHAYITFFGKDQEVNVFLAKTLGSNLEAGDIIDEELLNGMGASQFLSEDGELFWWLTPIDEVTLE